ncbi:uncharacterized protein TRIVIDRAFT_224245 [Trichoderma virens Gv29-8]|uniref:Uncharacterized protein n=1 Tax=Hypocrea virens (strain Gv29-8 / FGSC 10586) TaxID=413071 RepID=G9MZL1_HYPVG|nr:uncharacterized protein TRIVIDRAFT_224245 [Trichoderma virens Gv29-8]EHK20067.1 hypothetical protein TRIVIDRAFT_224245 [Trichoderma virens Gv29-8]UKZ45988.1 hypothetical protein TrVGV298_000184 [Trichoderma virens]
MARWNDLPNELREWKNYFEQKTFQKLVLNYSCISDFRQIVRGREDIVKHIWLRIQPPKWECSTCGNLEPSDRLSRNSRIFTNALWQLMEILGSWDEMDRINRGQGLTLEISVHAPSNLKHHFDCCTFDKDIHPCRSPEACTGKESCSLSRQLLPLELRSNVCDVVRNHLNLVEELRAVENVYLDFSDVDNGKTTQLPTVNCVTELTIRPINVRRFDRQTVKEIVRSFGKLEKFN